MANAFRCLDPTHPPNCTVCTPPPAADEIHKWQLHAPASEVAAMGHSAEKQLRSLLSRTPEWTADDTRLALADRVSTPRLSNALRKRLSSALRKADMIELARLWQYRSSLWQPSSQPPGGRSDPTAHQATWQLQDVTWDAKRLRATGLATSSGGADGGRSTDPTVLAPPPPRDSGPSVPPLRRRQFAAALARESGGSHCRVPGCKGGITSQAYDRRVRLCEEHKRAIQVGPFGPGEQPQRFCQKCARLHDVIEFKGSTRTCRRMLDRHNARRRHKTANGSGGSSGSGGSGGSGGSPAGGSKPGSGDGPGSGGSGDDGEDRSDGAAAARDGDDEESFEEDFDAVMDFLWPGAEAQTERMGGHAHGAVGPPDAPLLPVLAPPASLLPLAPPAPPSSFMGLKLALDSPTMVPYGLAPAIAHPFQNSLLSLEGAINPGCVHLLLHAVADPITCPAGSRTAVAAHARAMAALRAALHPAVMASGMEVQPTLRCVDSPHLAALAPTAGLVVCGTPHFVWFHGRWVDLRLARTTAQPAGGDDHAPGGAGITTVLPPLPQEGAVLVDHAVVALLISDEACRAEINAGPRDETAAHVLLALGILLHDSLPGAQGLNTDHVRLATRVAAAALGLGWRRTAMLAIRRVVAASKENEELQVCITDDHSSRGSLLHEALRLGDAFAATELLAMAPPQPSSRVLTWAQSLLYSPAGHLWGLTPMHVAAACAPPDAVLPVLQALMTASPAAAAVAWVCATDGQGASPSMTLRARLLSDALPFLSEPQQRRAALLLAMDKDAHDRVAVGTALLAAGVHAAESVHGVFLPSHQAALVPALLRRCVARALAENMEHPNLTADAVDVAAALLAWQQNSSSPCPFADRLRLQATRLWCFLHGARELHLAAFRGYQLAATRRSVALFLLIPTIPNIMMIFQFPPWTDLSVSRAVLSIPGEPQRRAMQLYASFGWYRVSLACNLLALAIVFAPFPACQRLYARHSGLLLGGTLAMRYIVANVLSTMSTCAEYGDIPTMCPGELPCHVLLMQFIFTVFAGLMPMRAGATCVVLATRMLFSFMPSLGVWFKVNCYGSNAPYLVTNTAISLVMMAHAVRQERSAWITFQRRALGRLSDIPAVKGKQ